MEECIGIDGTVLNEVLIPVMNISRRAANGEKDDNEVLNKSQIYVNVRAKPKNFPKEIFIYISVVAE
jgi:hypothetical protein